MQKSKAVATSMAEVRWALTKEPLVRRWTSIANLLKLPFLPLVNCTFRGTRGHCWSGLLGFSRAPLNPSQQRALTPVWGRSRAYVLSPPFQYGYSNPPPLHGGIVASRRGGARPGARRYRSLHEDCSRGAA